MPTHIDKIATPRRLVEAFVLINLWFLAPDIYLAHSVNSFRRWAEWIPLWFSLGAPAALLLGMGVSFVRRRWAIDRAVGLLVGAGAVVVGVTGLVLHLQSHFFQQETIKNLVYTAPFMAPLAYAALGLLLILDRTTVPGSSEWSRWVVALALGGFIGNFGMSLADHAQNGFFHWAEWVPVISAALAVGFLTSLLLFRVGRSFLHLCVAVLLLQLLVGLLGFALHARADLRGPSADMFDNFIYGAPIFAPLLFDNLVLLAGIGLWAMARLMPPEVRPSGTSPTTSD